MYKRQAFFITKLIADKDTHQLLGVQVLGPGAVDKMVDIAVMGMSMGCLLYTSHKERRENPSKWADGY